MFGSHTTYARSGGFTTEGGSKEKGGLRGGRGGRLTLGKLHHHWGHQRDLTRRRHEKKDKGKKYQEENYRMKRENPRKKAYTSC